MPLHQMLSALRELILDECELPSSAADREIKIGQYFPGLSPVEREELAKIPPERFRVYTGTIFRGEASLLRRLFPMSFAYIASGWQEAFGSKFNAFEFAKELHHSKPWNGYRTIDLTKRFIEFIDQDLKPITDRYPELPELAKLEEWTLKISRGSDDASVPVVSAEDLSTMTVSDVMALRYMVRANAVFLKCVHDILSCRTAYLRGDKLPLESGVVNNHISIVGARADDFSTHWLTLPEAIFDCLCRLPRLEPASLQDLADSFLDAQEVELPEIEMFQKFFALLVSCIQSGAIVLTR